MIKKDLIAATRDILLPGDFHEQLAPAIKKYHDLLCEALQINPENETQRMHIQTNSGNAIGVFWAANCVKEIFRTQRFVKGLAQAIKDLHREKKKTVHVLYAGTGPFAALALPIMLHFKQSEVKFTLLEINEYSCEKLKKLLEALDLLAYVKQIELADATTYLIKDNDIDIILSETMNLALYKEPQVSIMLNLGKQVSEETIFIPQEIKVSVCKHAQNLPLEKLKQLIQFNKNFIKENTGLEQKSATFEKHEVSIHLQGTERLLYLTEITIYKNFKLGLNDSSLTLLKPLKLEQKNGKITLELQYQISENPGFVFKTIEE